jgi:hypothetical protein
MKIMRLLIVTAILLACGVAAGADPPTTRPIHLPTDIALHDQKDRPVTPLDLPAGHRAVVLLFISTDCPISNSYAPAIGDFCRSFTPKGIDFYTVYEDPSLTPAAARAHHDAYAFPCDGLLDSQQALAHATGARVTPEVVVVGPGGLLLYRGRIDNLYVSVGRKRYTATTHELRDVLLEVAADQAVTVSSMPSVGCSIP